MMAKTEKYTVDFSYHPDGLPVDKLFLFGSWSKRGRYSLEWAGGGTPLKRLEDGSYHARVNLYAQPGQAFTWGVKDTNNHWMFFEHQAQEFAPSKVQIQEFRLGYRHFLGLHQVGRDGFRAAVWAPKAKSVSLHLESDPESNNWPMTRHNEFWVMESHNGWRAISGHPYGFLVTTSCGQTVLRADPYARVRQGPQRGLSDLFVSSSGEFRHRYNVEENGHHLLRFEATPPHGQRLRHPPVLQFFEGSKKLNAQELRERFPLKPSLPKHEEWWKSHLKSDGSIQLKKHPKTQAYSICIGPESALRGLRYKLEDHCGNIYHDPWDQRLDGHHNWPRLGIVQARRQAGNGFDRARQPEDLVMYELHVGSLLGWGENLRTSHFAEISEVLPKLKRLGFNTIALMPTNATEGWREWGYLGTSTLAHQEAFSNPGQDAESSLIDFINRAHKLGLRVLTDVVYNHVGGFHSDLWEFDGLENSWFERDADPITTGGDLSYRPFETVDAKPRTAKPSVRNTPWGPIPAYNRSAVSQFYVDHAMDQIERLGFDGLRFDFTSLIHNVGAGDAEGWEMLRAIHLRIRYFFPGVVTFAEEFPPHAGMTNPVDGGGCGFTGMWNTEHQHRLIFDHNRPSITLNLVEDCYPHLDLLLEQMTFPHGFSTPCTSATVLSNHDEVGNARRLYQLVRKHPRGLDIARLVSWFSLLCPGYPILFQGTEDLASNYFSWGLPHTWDVGSHLSQQKLPHYRTQHVASIRDVLNLRRNQPDLWAHSPIRESYLHEPRQMLAICRGDFWIVGNFGPAAQDVPNHITNQAKLVLSSEKKSYGYLGKTTRGSRIGGYAVKVWRLPSDEAV
jgi:maltooligosyltrehalose trehalohydrolase